MFRVSTALNAAFEAASCEHALRTFERLLAVLARQRFEAPLLTDAHRALVGARGSSAHRALGALHQVVALTEFRHTPLFYFPVQTFVMWDMHVWWGLERWQQKHGKQLRGWLEAAGQVEALSALASLAHAQPSWTFPRVAPPGDLEATKVEARRLGHPLLADEVRVPNDVAVGPPGTFLLITGSNMSGKSTLLRAVGLNAVLAHAGGPVCAERFTLPPLTLRTSMRVSDSLERGLSLFMASLLRLERVVSAARAANPRTRPLLYLLDEVLQGTNSAERQIAVRTDRATPAAPRRHRRRDDARPELAAAPDFAAHADSRHLTETLTFVDGEVKMTFDHTPAPPAPPAPATPCSCSAPRPRHADTLDRITPADPVVASGASEWANLHPPDVRPPGVRPRSGRISRPRDPRIPTGSLMSSASDVVSRPMRSHSKFGARDWNRHSSTAGPGRQPVAGRRARSSPRNLPSGDHSRQGAHRRCRTV